MKAKDWAIEIWKKSQEDWINKIQDNNYRDYIVRPALEDKLSDIIEPERPPFYVPYFHRDLSDYIELFETYFHIELVKGLKPSNKLLEKSRKEKICPFYRERHNVYWKEISEVSSSLIIKGVKK